MIVIVMNLKVLFQTHFHGLIYQVIYEMSKDTWWGCRRRQQQFTFIFFLLKPSQFFLALDAIFIEKQTVK